MSKKVLILSTSLRGDSNSEILAAEFAKGAASAGHAVESISLKGKMIHFCTGCLICQKTQRCVIHDDADAIVQRMLTADAIVFATPIYYYEMSGQMKTLLDRANPLFTTDYAFHDVYLLAAAADDDPSAIDGTLHGLRGWISCFERAKLSGFVLAAGLTDGGSIQNAEQSLKEAYAMGAAL